MKIFITIFSCLVITSATIVWGDQCYTAVPNGAIYNPNPPPLDRLRSYAPDGKIEYRGKAPVGTATSEAAWSISKSVYDGEGELVGLLSPDLQGGFRFVWDLRETYEYPQGSMRPIHHIIYKIAYDPEGIPTFNGWAVPGTAESEPGWRIQKLYYDAENRAVGWASPNCSEASTFVWDQRESYSYATE